MSNIPLVDLAAQHKAVGAEILEGMTRVMERTAFILGPEVAAFEKEFAAFCQVKHCIGVANGTDALELLIRAAGVGKGDEVLVPANTFIATALAVERAGATVVLVDSDPTHHMINVELAARKVTPRTKAIMPVHLYGQVAPMEAVGELAKRHKLLVLEDAAQSQGAARNGVRAGGFGLGAGTSFYPGKNLGAYGDAGAVITGDDAVADKVRALRNYGSTVKYQHPETGFNSRLDTLQAVVLSAKLKRLDGWNAQRRAAAKIYEELLKGVQGVTLPSAMAGNEHIWHLYVVRVPQRDKVLADLNAAGVGAGIHYPKPIHLQGAFKHLGHKAGDFPVAEKAAGEIVSLPMFAEITRDQQVSVVDALKKAVKAHGA